MKIKAEWWNHLKLREHVKFKASDNESRFDGGNWLVLFEETCHDCGSRSSGSISYPKIGSLQVIHLL